jgi:midasin (ATPase involved in ribosome maturation)
MTAPTYSLPLSDADRATLRLHAASIGKSPAQSDEALIAIYNGTTPPPVAAAPTAADAAAVADILRKPVTERLVQAAKEKVQTITDAAVDAAVKAAVDAVQVHRTVRIEVKRCDDIKVLSDEYRHPIFMDVLTALSVRENVYLVGGAGSGKTTLAKQAADALGLPFYSTGAVGMAYQLQGFINAEGDYMATDLYRAYTEGGVFLFDEIDGSSANAILAFNAIAANDFAAFPNGTVKRHDDFVIIAAANTYGNGANRDYIGRAPLDGSSLDRFGFIAMDYDEKLELAISLNDVWTRWVQQCRKVANEHRMQVIISPRASIKGGKMLSAGMSVDKVADMYIFKGMTQADRARFPSLPAL